LSEFRKSVKIKTYKTIIMPVVLYGCETWSLRDEHRLSTVVRSIFDTRGREWRGVETIT